jgi:endonuclease III
MITPKQDSMKRYTAKVVSKELWLEARSDAIRHGKTIAEWITEAIKEKLGKK